MRGVDRAPRVGRNVSRLARKVTERIGSPFGLKVGVSWSERWEFFVFDDVIFRHSVRVGPRSQAGHTSLTPSPVPSHQTHSLASHRVSRRTESHVPQGVAVFTATPPGRQSGTGYFALEESLGSSWWCRRSRRSVRRVHSSSGEDHRRAVHGGSVRGQHRCSGRLGRLQVDRGSTKRTGRLGRLRLRTCLLMKTS